MKYIIFFVVIFSSSLRAEPLTIKFVNHLVDGARVYKRDFVRKTRMVQVGTRFVPKVEYIRDECAEWYDIGHIGGSRCIGDSRSFKIILKDLDVDISIFVGRCERFILDSQELSKFQRCASFKQVPYISVHISSLGLRYTDVDADSCIIL